MTRISPLLPLAMAAALLVGCGSKGAVSPLLPLAKSLAATVASKAAGGGAAPPVSRAALEALGAPITFAEIESLKGTLYLAPLIQIDDVETWSTSDDITVSYRGGVLAATRGLGPDLMESATPALSRIRSGAGRTARSYGFLDGSDALVRQTYACQLERQPDQAVSVFGIQHMTHHIVEKCTDTAGKNPPFSNEYWFDLSGKIRKSKELLVPGSGYIILSRVVDS